VRCEGVCIKLLTFTIDYDREQFRNRRGLAPRLLSISSMLRACRQPTFPDLLLTGGKCALPPDVGVGFFRWRPTKVSNFAQLPLGSARNNESGGDGAAPPLSQLGGVRFSKGSEPPKDQQRAPLCRLQFGRKICHDHNLPLAFSSACRPPLGIAAETPKVSACPCAN